MSEERLRNLEDKIQAMAMASEIHHRDMKELMGKVEKTLTQLAIVLTEQSTFKDELTTVRKNVHDALNTIARLPMLEQRVANLEDADKKRESELKTSFAKRDDRHSSLAKLVYIGVGITLALQVVGVFIVSSISH